MAAERTESEGAAFTESDIKSCKSEELNRVSFYGVNQEESWWFLDLGFVYDQSCLVACYKTKAEDGQTIYNFPVYLYPVAHRHPEMWGFEPSDYENVPAMVNRHGGDGAYFELDLTGKEGNEVNAHNAGLSCSGVKMTGPWKAKWYDRLIALVKMGRVKVQYVDNFVDGHNKNFDFQARSLRISTKTPDGRNRPYPLYHHSSEKDHDDILDAIVGCLSLADDELYDGDTYDMELVPFAKKSYNQVDKGEDSVPSFEEFIKSTDIPSFMSKEALREWYEKRYGLR
jgi:hypothetical protein